MHVCLFFFLACLVAFSLPFVSLLDVFLLCGSQCAFCCTRWCARCCDFYIQVIVVLSMQHFCVLSGFVHNNETGFMSENVARAWEPRFMEIVR